MGALVSDPNVPNIQNSLNNRFAPGDPLREMVAVQKEFDVFSLQHSLVSVVKLLNLAPTDRRDRLGWFKFLDHLKSVPSDKKGVSGHDRIIAALKENLESKSPLPCWFTWQPGIKLTVTRNVKVLDFSKIAYLRIAVPIRGG